MLATLGGSGMTDNWYDNKDIYEMLQEVRQDISSLRQKKRHKGE